MQPHSITDHHGLRQPLGMTERGPARRSEGRFGELFPHLPRLISDPGDLFEAGRKGGPMDAGLHAAIGSCSTPLGYIFLGQFVDHDITLDVVSSLERVNEAAAIRNVRSPTLDLDCIYGSGPEGSRHLYYHAPPKDVATPRQLEIDGRHLLTRNDDLVRAESHPPDNPRRAALIGDPRNDENRVVSQLQLTMHYFHNAVVDHILQENKDIAAGTKPGDPVPEAEIFEEAQRLTRWHYQWVVVRDFLVRMVGRETVVDILANGRKIYTCCEAPFIPIEFAVAAYRFGHSMIAETLDYRDDLKGVTLFGAELGRGFQVNAAGPIAWKHLFGPTARTADPLDIRLAPSLLDLPFMDPGPLSSLATRNLLRGQSFGLPSGQNVHRAISEACGRTLETPNLGPLNLPKRLEENTPLWLYILAEGEVSKGQHLGPVGGRIVAEVLIGLMELDERSFVASDRSWRPTLPGSGPWTMDDLLAFAGYGV